MRKQRMPEAKHAEQELSKAYVRAQEGIRERHRVVKVTAGSLVDEALGNYERLERVARDIKKEVVRKGD